jgi:apolipoprotein N-acyltransferase
VVAHYGGLLVPNFFMFLPMLLWLDAHRGKRLRDVARGAAVFGLATYGIGLHWIYAMLSISWLAALMYLGLLVLFTAGAVAGLTLAGWTRRWTGWSYGALLPACWIPMEWLRTWGDLRMTADHVAHGLAPFPFVVQFADLTGPYGVGAFLLACNGLLHGAVSDRGTRRGRREAVALAGLVLAVLTYDGWAWTHPPAEVGRVRVAIVQPNVPLVIKWSAAEDARQEEILAAATREAAKARPRIVVWPESARPTRVRHWLDDPATFAMPEVQALARETGADILTGVEYQRIRSREEYEYFNAALVAHADGTVDPAWTAKTYLVPFTEGIPFRRALGPLLEGLGGDLHWLSGGFTPGPAAVLLPAAGWRAGVLVCYEEFYFDLARRIRNAGADFQVVLTNDAWFGRTVFQSLLADVVRMRAIETRSSFVRAANTGISGFVDPMGRYHQRTALFAPAVEVRDVTITRARTVYMRLGDVVAWIAIASLCGIVLVTALRRRQGDTP